MGGRLTDWIQTSLNPSLLSCLYPIEVRGAFESERVEAEGKFRVGVGLCVELVSRRTKRILLVNERSSTFISNR